MTCNECQFPNLCAFCINGELDEEGQAKAQRIVEGRRIVEETIKAQSAMAIYHKS